MQMEANTSLREALKIRIADFKGCVLLQLLLLLFEKPVTSRLHAATRDLNVKMGSIEGNNSLIHPAIS